MAGTNGDRVTNRQLYEALTALREELPTRREVRLTVALAVLGGNAVAAGVLKFTSAGPTAHEVAVHALRWLS